jgi:hypothetical protein
MQAKDFAQGWDSDKEQATCLHIWFTAFLLMSATKKGFSALNSRDNLG